MSRPHWRLPAFRPRARRRDGNTCRTCHEMSCFVMRAGRTPCDVSWNVMICMRMVHVPCLVPAWSGRFGRVLPVFHPVSRVLRLRHGLSFRSIFVPFFPSPRRTRRTLQMAALAPPPGCPERRDPSFARILRGRACARPRAFRGGAVRAPDCARETQGAPLPCVSQGFFRAGTNGETKRPRECRFLPPATHDNTVSIRSISKLGKYFKAGIAKRFHRAIRSARIERLDTTRAVTPAGNAR